MSVDLNNTGMGAAGRGAVKKAFLANIRRLRPHDSNDWASSVGAAADGDGPSGGSGAATWLDIARFLGSNEGHPTAD